MTQKINKNLLLTNSRFIKQRSFWLSKLTNDIEDTKLFLDNEKNGHRQTQTHTDRDKIDIPFPESLSHLVIKLGKQSEVSIYIILLAVLKSLIYRYKEDEDITVISPVYQEYLTKYTMNHYVFIRDLVAGDTTFKELLLMIKQTVLDAYLHQDYPLDRVVEKLFDTDHVQRKRCISNVVCALKNLHSHHHLKEEKDKLVFYFSKENGGIIGSIRYDPGIYNRYYIKQMSKHYITLLEHALNNVEEKISRIHFLTDEEKDRLLYIFNQGEESYHGNKTIDQLFAEQVKITAHRIALVYGDRQLTYCSLNERARRLAAVLRCKGIKQDCLVGIMVDRGIEMIIGMMGVLMAGGAYLPIDRTFPVNRIKYIIKDSNLNVLLMDQKITDNLGFEGNHLDINSPDIYEGKSAGSSLENAHFSGSLAYVIYTSGSTGQPKGVMVTHENVMGYINAFLEEFQLTSNDTVIQQASPSFDAFVEEVFPILSRGGKAAIPQKHEIIDMELLSKFILDTNARMISCSPLLLNELNKLDHEKIKPITTFISGGDELKTDHVDNLVNAGVVYNTYGPTETTVCATYYKCLTPSADRAGLPIGKPISNYRVYILGKSLYLLPVGVSGELCITGIGVTNGYLNLPELTAERFIDNPFGEGRLFRSGDLGKWLPDGNIEFQGRIDHQVKIRGYRIELGEIEHQLKKYPGLKETVVVMKEDETGDKYLCTYYTARTEISVRDLRTHLGGKLPDYMIPSYFMQLNKLPVTTNGKLDRRELPAPVAKSGAVYAAPTNRVEEELVLLWAEILGIKKKKIGIDDNFFELGGHSLKATVLASEVHRRFNIKVPLKVIFNYPTLKKFAEYIEAGKEDRYAPIEAVEKKEYYPLSSAQKRLYILQQMDIKSIAYNMPGIIYLNKDPDSDRLLKTFKELINKHESFRTSFEMVNEEPVQKINKTVDFKLDYYELDKEECQGNPSDLYWQMEKVIHNVVQPFDLSQAPILRVGLIATKKNNILLVDMHHIISDGVSQQVLEEEFNKIYIGDDVPVQRLHYKDYTNWQNSEKQEEKIKAQEEYWVKELSGELPILTLPMDFVRPSVQSFQGNQVTFALDSTEAGIVKSTAQKTGTTLNMVFLSIYYILLSKLSGQEDIIIGNPIAARRHVQLQRIIGMFANILALRNYPSGNKTFKEFLMEVKIKTLEAFENQEYQFEELVDKLCIYRNSNRNPIFDVVFSFADQEKNAGGILEHHRKDGYFHMKRSSKFDFSIIAIESNNFLTLTFEYSTELFKPVTIERFIKHFRKIISALGMNIEANISDMEIMSAEERKQVIYEFNHTQSDYPRDKTIHELFTHQVAKTPDNTALVGTSPREPGKLSLTYEKLNHRSNQLAKVLRNKGVKPDTIVGIMVERSIEMMVSILAVLKAGGTYLPIDIESPGKRVKYMLDNGAVPLLLTNSPVIKEKHKWLHGREILLLDELSLNIPGYNLESISSPRNLAYTMFTSGSTGQPKAVLVEHQNVVRLVKNTNFISLKEEDHLLQTAPLEFDASTIEIWGSLLNGLCFHLSNENNILNPGDLKELIKKYDINIMWMTSPLFNQMLEVDIEIFSGLKQFMIGGDVLSPTHINQLHARFPELDIINGYGPTENTTFSTTYLIEREFKGNIPIGKPIANSTSYILDRYEKVIPIGIAGELYVGGDGVSRGYLNNPEFTSEKFILNPLNKGERLYKTGDMAEWLADGNINFLGRIDHQVKIRGIRIELGEIESQLLTRKEIKEAVVVLRKDRNEDKHMYAYVVLRKEQGNIDMEVDFIKIKKELSETLPDYMIPSRFVQLEKIPLTPNGKVDRNALPEPGLLVGGDYIAPRNELEKKLVEIWSDTLNINKEVISIHSNFFELGGHSLKATVLVSKLQKRLNVKVPLTEIFTSPTVIELAGFIKNSDPHQFVAIEPTEKKEYYELSSAQKRIYIMQQMEVESTIYNIPDAVYFDMSLDIDRMEQTLRELLKRHESFRTSFELVDEKHIQKIHDYDEVDFSLKYYDSSRMDEIKNSFVRPFDLSKAPLLRIGLIRSRENDILLIDMHHIISDGISHQVLRNEFQAIYSGKELSKLRLQYKDYAMWQNSSQQMERVKKQEEYWLSIFSDELPVLNFPADYPRPVIQNFAGNSLNFEIAVEETRALKESFREAGVTLFMTLLALYYVLLAKVTGQEDIVVGTAVGGRRHPDLQPIPGMFVNLLALRNYPTAEKSFRDFLMEVKENTLNAFDNQDYQFEDLVEHLLKKRDPSRNPLFDVVFSFQDLEFTGAGAPHVELKPFFYESQIARYDMTMNAVDGGDKLFFRIEYSTEMFKQETIQRFIGYFKEILSMVLEEKKIKLSDIKISHDYEDSESNLFPVDFEFLEMGYKN